jgi:phage terminase Nu1 subunit (DNA packaging protein)
MPSKKKLARAQATTGPLKGWAAIADFLKMPASTAQRWTKAGMPVRREGRSTVADPGELLSWIGHEAQMPGPAHIATNTADLAAGLKESIANAQKKQKKKT